MTTLSASQARIPTDVFNRVAYSSEVVRVEHRSSKRSVYLISEADRDLLEQAKKRAAFEESKERIRERRGEMLRRLAD